MKKLRCFNCFKKSKWEINEKNMEMTCLNCGATKTTNPLVENYSNAILNKEEKINIYTAQMSKKTDKKEIDITIKSGVKVFAPTWTMVNQYKEGENDKKEYSKLYREKMRKSLRQNRRFWYDLLKYNKELVLKCYCPKNKFCHRKLLVKYLKKVGEEIGIAVDYKGEL